MCHVGTSILWPGHLVRCHHSGRCTQKHLQMARPQTYPQLDQGRQKKALLPSTSGTHCTHYPCVFGLCFCRLAAWFPLGSGEQEGYCRMVSFLLTWRVGARVDTNSGPALQDISWEQVQGEALLWVGGSLSAFTTSTVVTVPSWIIQNQLLLE